MFSLSQRIIIDAPADVVWDIVGAQFARIGEWATVIPASAGVPGGRICHTGLAMVPEVTEKIVAYDDARRTLMYEATDGMPAFVTSARNHWTVTALSGRRTEAGF